MTQPRFGIIPVRGFALAALSGAIDALRRRGADWAILAPDMTSLRAENGLLIQPDAPLSAAGDKDCLVLIGADAAGPPILPADVADALRHAEERSCPVVALCCGQPDQIRALRGLPADMRSNEALPLCGVTADIDRLIARVIADLGGDMTAGRMQQTCAARDPLVAQALQHMRDNLETARTVDALARVMGVGRRKMERHFRADIGISPQSAYATLRLEKAMDLLRDTEEPLSEIALSCGFCDSSHLVRMMKARLGLTPGQFREAPTRA